LQVAKYIGADDEISADDGIGNIVCDDSEKA
jgi:hypothetical protein